MKEILLSFKSEYFKPLLYGIKKYEYRKRFCDEETKAYLYLSGKARLIIGALELLKPIRLDSTRNDYIDYPNTLKRVDNYISNSTINAIPIKSLSLFKNPISLDDIRNRIPGFMPPQLYYVLDNNPQLKCLLEAQPISTKLFSHNHDKIYFDNLAMSVSELKKTEEFNKLDKLYSKNDTYKNILSKI